MGTLLYVRLIGYTAGTLLMLFWMVVILGYRRQRNFERVFFFLCLAFFCFYGGSLLAINAQLYYVRPPETLNVFSWMILSLGLCFLPPFLAHLHLEYADGRGLLRSSANKRLLLAGFYAPVIFFVLRAYPQLTTATSFDFLTPGNSLGRGFGVWLGASLAFSAAWEILFGLRAPDFRQGLFHRLLGGLLLLAAAMALQLHVFYNRFALQYGAVPPGRGWLSASLALLPLLPLGLLVYYARRFNFLQIARQRNLLYAVSVTFFALLYLSLVRRVSQWLEPILPPEASAAILLFVLVIFIEPLQRVLSRQLKETAQQEIDQAQRIVSAIQEVARQGYENKLLSFAEQWLCEKLELAEAKIMLTNADASSIAQARAPSHIHFPIERGDRWFGHLSVRPHGAMLSGETRAALEFVCEQFPAALDLCRLIEEKLRLERELAERERLAVLGQMAASISHNLKNPLGSIKTILQVQLENPEMPDSLKSETQMVLAEISRLSNKLAQLLQFSRPAIFGEAGGFCDLVEVLKEVTEVLRHEADRKGIHFESPSNGSLPVAVGREAVSDILSNLIVNALEAAASHGNVRVLAVRENGRANLRVEDDGKGIPTELREKVMQPFFTTKTQGTGLGLAIVAKRVAEANGTLEIQSPISDGRGTRFSVWLPLRGG